MPLYDARIITCLIGPAETPFQVHAKALNSFLKPQTVEELGTGAGHVTIYFPDVDEITFGHCCEFAYTGNYSVGITPGPVTGNGDIGNVKDCLFNQNILTCNLFHPQLLPYFHNLSQKYANICPTFQPSKPADDYAEILLCHARIYCYAFSSDFPALCVLSLNHLVKLLEGLVLCPRHIKDLVKLFEFVFEEGESSDYLQHILCDYMVWNVEALMQDSAFLDFLDGSPNLEKIIFRRMWV
ncbi:hypothetical protein BDV12DRAFT_209877 [Aspergillus spectabilis]